MAKSTTDNKVDADVVRELAQLLDETGLTEIELGRDNWHVRVSKAPAFSAPQVTVQPAVGVPAAAAAVPPAEHPGAVNSPMVGIVYLAPEDGAAMFVSVGDIVSEGQTLLLIEAMKVFNPITAPAAGKVTSILVSNGAPVEFGEPLLIIE